MILDEQYHTEETKSEEAYDGVYTKKKVIAWIIFNKSKIIDISALFAKNYSKSVNKLISCYHLFIIFLSN